MATTYVRNDQGEFEPVGPGGAATDTTLSQLGKPADAAAVGAALTNYATEAYVSGITNDIQAQLDGKAASSHGTHVSFTTTAPKLAGTAAAGSATTVSRSDHVHPAQTTVSGNAGSATKLATARTIRTNLNSTSTASFNGTANVTPGVTGTLPVANGGTGATSAVDARKNLGIYVYTGYIKTSSEVAAHGLLSDYVSAKTLFGFETVPSNFTIVSATSKSTYFSCNFSHEVGTDSINIKMRNVSGVAVGATNYYYTIVGMLV